MINKILKYLNMKLNWIYKEGVRDFSNEFYPRPSTIFIGNLSKNFTEKSFDNNSNKDLVGVEIGVAKGNNAKSMLKTLNIKQLYLVDPYLDEDYKLDGEQAEKNTKKYEKVITRIFRTSADAVQDIPDELDFIYIDGNHSYESVKEDIKNYYPKLKVGGVLAGHDIDNYFTNNGVFKGVNEFANLMGLKLYIQSPDWWIVKV